MRRIAPLLVALLILVACGDSDEEASPTSTTIDSTEVDVETTDSQGVDTGSAEDPGTTVQPTTTEAATPESETTAAPPTENEVALLCSAYLDVLVPSRFDQGLAGLSELLGEDAPAGVLDAIDVLQDAENDVESFFRARNSIDGYVLPVCEQQFTSAVTPLADDATAADTFVAAVRDGDRLAAEGLAPTNVIVQFDWVGYPQLTADFEPDNTTLSMVLEPTVTVFCQLAGGAIEFCAFGE